ncbi:CCR4-Not complex scaffold subunit 1 [Schizosaccharomyces osmophilus]|uniref:CCR4-Not complex scaffold subunit 1 n=1 Tax=Schizosaccharomyces osmophilus TaxID=2545709 RepID=A0AAF0AUL5_9SCHI|nr:CCR4-Not complex scaffold subunit 1 [Schizosaccharomyces osmophilus]WBW71015.1 CCR4-Not complex scaffold subunit 1 [Schizosaccharomyces osmophilus]
MSDMRDKSSSMSDSNHSLPLENKTTAPNDSKIESIVKAQILFLLSTLREDQYDTKLEQIRQLINKNAPGVYHHFLRRLVQGNSYRIFGTGKSSDGLATYKLLLDELKSLTKSWALARRFSDAISGSDSEVFEDFDIETFLNHFQFSPLERTNILIGLTTSIKPSLSKKASALLKEDFQPLLNQLSNPNLQPYMEKVDLDMLREGLFTSDYDRVPLIQVPKFDLVVEKRLANCRPLAALFGNLKNSKATLKTMKEAITKKYPPESVTESDVAFLINSLVAIHDYGSWDTVLMGKAIVSAFEHLDWESMLPMFDNPKFMVTGSPSLILFMTIFTNAFKLKQRIFTLDFLWNLWKNPLSQLSIISHIILTPISLFDIKGYNITPIVSAEDLDGYSEELVNYAKGYEQSNLNCLELVRVLLRLLTEVVTYETSLFLNFLDEKISAELLLLGTLQLSMPWNQVQESLAFQWCSDFFSNFPQHKFVFHRIEHTNPQFLFAFLRSLWLKDSLSIGQIVSFIVENNFVEHVNSIQPNRFALEIAALACARKAINFQAWLDGRLSEFEDAESLNIFLVEVLDFLMVHAALQKSPTENKEQVIPLSIDVVNILLTTLMDNVSISEEVSEHIKDVQILCLQVYPRLFALGHDRDDLIINVNGTNSFSPDVEAEVESFFQALYERKLSIGKIVLTLQTFKKSEDPRDLDLFACLQHSLFDEYRFFPDYPLEALALTAVLFGSLIQFDLLSFVPLGVALRYVYQALLMPTDTKMFRFGMQALVQFQDKLPKYINYCNLILGIPSLQLTRPDIYNSIKEMIASAETSTLEAEKEVVIPETSALPSPKLPSYSFVSIRVPALSFPSVSGEIQESVCDNILFALNNLSQLNFNEKLQTVKESLKPPYLAWFSHYIVTQRVSREANFLTLYSKFLEELKSNDLYKIVFRDTLQAALDILDLDSETLSSIEKSSLKNLGSWLGSITLARNKSITTMNVSFKDLLLEGVDSERIDRVLPFVCKVLEKVTSSDVFKPPNPWLMGILRLLVELYQFADFRLNMKFEIELLLQNINVKIEEIEPSELYRNHLIRKADLERDLPEDVGSQDLRSDANIIMQYIAAASPQIIVSDAVTQIFGKSKAAIKNSMHLIIQQSVLEIISAVVRRSVGISAITTESLIQKDFAAESNPSSLLLAARQMAKTLAGNLAMVTCREPLQMLMINNLRTMILQDVENVHAAVAQAIDELVLQNLFIASSIVETVASETAIAEIDAEIEPMIVERVHHRKTNPNVPFVDPAGAANLHLNLPGILKLSSDLAPQQFQLYENFDRLSLFTIMSNSGYGNVSEARSEVAEGSETPNESVNVPMEDEVNQAALNYARNLLMVIAQILQLSSQVPFTSMQEVPAEHEFHDLVNQFLTGVAAINHPIADHVFLLCAQECCRILLTESASPFILEVFCAILEYICQASKKTAISVSLYWNFSSDIEKLNLPVILSLIRFGILTTAEVDYHVARGIDGEQGKGPVTTFAIGLLNTAVSGENPMALPGNFVNSISSLYKHSPIFAGEVKEAYDQLFESMGKIASPAQDILAVLDNKEQLNDQMIIIFVSWVHLLRNSATDDALKAAFVYQLHKQGILGDLELAIQFFRCNLEAVLVAFLEAASANAPDYCNVDAFASLIVNVVKYSEAKSEESTSLTKSVFFRKIMALITGIFAELHNAMDEFVHQKTFFRLFSSILSELDESNDAFESNFSDIFIIILRSLLAVQPNYFPAFTFAWLSLISHAYLLPKILMANNEEINSLYSEILAAFLKFLSLKDGYDKAQFKLLYNGFLRIVLVLLHDFPGFLATHCYHLIPHIPLECVQLRNMILSAFPNDMHLPDPFAQGLKVGRLPEVACAPLISDNILSSLDDFGSQLSLDTCLISNKPADVGKLYLEAFSSLESSEELNEWANLFILWLIRFATKDLQLKQAPQFQPKSPECVIISTLNKHCNSRCRYFLLTAIANQLRYPSSYTYYASCFFLYLFKSSSNIPQELLIKEQMTMVLLERIICNRPHPWGLLITFTELLKNEDYNFWKHPYIRRNDEIRRLFDSLHEHIMAPSANIMNAREEGTEIMGQV